MLFKVSVLKTSPFRLFLCHFLKAKIESAKEKKVCIVGLGLILLLFICLYLVCHNLAVLVLKY